MNKSTFIKAVNLADGLHPITQILNGHEVWLEVIIMILPNTLQSDMLPIIEEWENSKYNFYDKLEDINQNSDRDIVISGLVLNEVPPKLLQHFSHTNSNQFKIVSNSSDGYITAAIFLDTRPLNRNLVTSVLEKEIDDLKMFLFEERGLKF